MPLDKTTLKESLLQLFTDMRTRTEVSDDETAQRFSDAIDAFVKSGDGEYQIGTLKAGSTVVTASPDVIVKMK